jgi:hypothetical protein
LKRLALTFALFSAAAFAGQWSGYISESKCGAAHQDASAKSIACVKGCIKGGAAPVLVTDGKVVKIANTDKVPEALYGLKVNVTGDLAGDALTIRSIEAAK